jgi:hypothetical protein
MSTALLRLLGGEDENNRASALKLEESPLFMNRLKLEDAIFGRGGSWKNRSLEVIEVGRIDLWKIDSSIDRFFQSEPSALLFVSYGQ